jgi:predicted secreted protein
MLFAIYDDGVFTGREFDFAEKPVLDGKPYRKFYAVEGTKPAFDTATQVRSGPVVEEDHVNEIRRYVWTVRAKTAPELDTAAEAKIDSVDMLVFKVLFNHENRIRTLAGQAQVTDIQFRNALKAML